MKDEWRELKDSNLVTTPSPLDSAACCSPTFFSGWALQKSSLSSLDIRWYFALIAAIYACHQRIS